MDQSKIAAFLLSSEVLILYSFPYIMRHWIPKFSLPHSPTDHNWVGEITNNDQKVTKVCGDNSDNLEFGPINLRLKFCPKLLYTKVFCKYRKSSK